MRELLGYRNIRLLRLLQLVELLLYRSIKWHPNRHLSWGSEFPRLEQSKTDQLAEIIIGATNDSVCPVHMYM